MTYELFRTKKDAKSDLKDSLQLITKNLETMKTEHGYDTYDIVRIGRFMEGHAYYHEVDQYYTCVGFEVELDVRFKFGDGSLSELKRETGFFSVWVGRSHQAAPFTFEESYKPFGESTSFDNGLGDHFSVTNVLASVSDIDTALSENKKIIKGANHE